MTKIKKQETVNRTLDFSNISNASKSKVQQKVENTVRKKKKVPIKFKVKKELVEKFHILRLEYAKSNKFFALSNNETFTAMVNFIYQEFIQINILKNCPKDFKKAITKVGKRTKNSRTAEASNSQVILFTVDELISDYYMDIMFSFIENDPNESIYNIYHNRTYFFYDFIRLIEKEKKSFLKYKSTLEQF